MNSIALKTSFDNISKMNAFDRNNLIGTFLIGLLPSVLGSSISVLIVIFAIWAIFLFCTNKLYVHLLDSDVRIAVAFTLFALAIVATGLFGRSYLALSEVTVWLVPFLFPWILIPRLRASPNINYLAAFSTGASAGAILGCVVGIAQLVLLPHRPAGGAGNPAVYGMMCLSLGAFGWLNISRGGKLAVLAILGLAAGLIGLAISQTRGTWIAAIPTLWLLLLYDRAALIKQVKRFGHLSTALVGLVLAALTGFSVLARLEQSSRDLALAAGYEGSLGERIGLWTSALQAIVESPLIGYGIQNRMIALQHFYEARTGKLAEYTHPHNGVLTAMLDGGVVVLVALIGLLITPLAVALHAPKDSEWRTRLFMSALLLVVYATNGMTQIMYKHDIIDSFLIYSAIVIAASIPMNSLSQSPYMTTT